MIECNEEIVLSDLRYHKIKILRDEGVNRHIRFKRPGDSSYWFDIVTWSGILTINGDCGTYVFSRVSDMFDFFRMKARDFHYHPERKLHINPGYWHEKLQASDGRGDNNVEEWDAEAFKRAVVESFRQYTFDTPAQRRECWEQVRSDLLENDAADQEQLAMHAVYDFSFHRMPVFERFWERRFRRYTFHYLWNLYAIVWGIQQYDAFTKAPLTTAENWA